MWYDCASGTVLLNMIYYYVDSHWCKFLLLSATTGPFAGEYNYIFLDVGVACVEDKLSMTWQDLG